MGKVVCHMNKSKSGNSGGLTLHIDRIQKEYSDNINTDRSYLNFELVKPTGTIDDMVKDRINEGYKGKKAIRKDAVTSQRYILSGSPEVMNKLSEKELAQWSIDSYQFFAQKYGEKNIIRATVHRDESTPHMHLIVVPLTADGRLSAKDFTGDSKKLKKLQTDYAKIVAKYGLSRGIEGSNRKHIDTETYYHYINKNELTAAEIIKHPHSVDLVTSLIEIADGKTNLEHIAEAKIKAEKYHKQTKQNQNERGLFEENKREGRREQEIKRDDKNIGFSM